MKIIKTTFADLSQEMIDDYFSEMQKCKILGKVSEIKQTEKKFEGFNEPCFLETKISLKGIYNFQLEVSYPTGKCTTDSPYYNFDEKYRPLPKKGDYIYTIIDKENYHIAKYGKNDYEKYSEIPICEINNQYNYYYFGIGIICLIISLILIYKLIKKDK